MSFNIFFFFFAIVFLPRHENNDTYVQKIKIKTRGGGGGGGGGGEQLCQSNKTVQIKLPKLIYFFNNFNAKKSSCSSEADTCNVMSPIWP